MMKLKYKYFAIDFDGTIVQDKFPHVGELLIGAKETLVKINEAGGQITIWTCREGQEKQECIEFLKANNVPYDFINCNHPDLIKKFGIDCRKIGADIYIDDKSMLGKEISWLEIHKHIFIKSEG
ncbi:hypothetical protein HB904_04070 [Listeria booriae]|uniref:Hydrolase n=1 Tax=Listeria booriae TaxID=1552123 RepID=A0A842ABM1_9LIST|nr:hypothetical protein [Listeria booriae]MBC1615349.1 hypothetical protein [Listeria booriae]